MLQDKKGFTLLELMVALTITVLMGVALSMIFRTSMDAWQKGEASIQRCQTARIALQRMSGDIRSAVLLTGWKDVTGKTIDVKFVGEDGVKGVFGDKLSFVTLAHQPDYYSIGDYYKYTDADHWEAAEISYYIYHSGTTNLDHLVRRWQTGDVPDDSITRESDGLGYTLASLVFRVTELNFSYYDGSIWQPSWNSDTVLPEMVWIGLTVQADVAPAGKEKKEEIFSTIVYLPSG